MVSVTWPFLGELALSSLSIARCASAMATVRLKQLPVLVRLSANLTVHLQPVGLDV
jgi:hypothetical protein